MGECYESIKDTFTHLAPKKARVANHFYKLLFTQAPELRPLFAETNPGTQREMLMGALSLVVKAAKGEFQDMSYFARLGKRHSKYNFDLKYFKVFNDCLLITLENELRATWSSEIKKQWEYALQQASQSMIDNMVEPSLPNKPTLPKNSRCPVLRG